MTGHSVRFHPGRRLVSDQLQQGERQKLGQDLKLRILSMLVMLPVALGVVYLGGWPFALTVGLAGAIMLLELFRLVDIENWIVAGIATAWVLAMGLYQMLMGSPEIALIVVGGGAVLAGLLAAGDFKVRLRAVGCFGYIALPCLLLVLLRDDQFAGFETLLWLFLAVWAMDIGAYISGRAIGGPKLWPAVSPNKTWSGFLGGVLLAGVTGLVFAAVIGSGGLLVVGLLAAIVAAWSQLGDLAESAIKRKFGVKDTSPLIPGHGGLLDRLDSTLFGAVAVVMIVIVRDGPVVPWS